MEIQMICLQPTVAQLQAPDHACDLGSGQLAPHPSNGISGYHQVSELGQARHHPIGRAANQTRLSEALDISWHPGMRGGLTLGEDPAKVWAAIGLDHGVHVQASSEAWPQANAECIHIFYLIGVL